MQPAPVEALYSAWQLRHSQMWIES